MTNKLKTTTFLAFVATFAIGISYTYASWTGPTATPPNSNTSAPLNISSVTQYKAGPLGVGGYFETFSGMNMNGKNINGVAAPIAGTDAVNKDYVDALGGGGGAGGGTPCGSYLTNSYTSGPNNNVVVGTVSGCVVTADGTGLSFAVAESRNMTTWDIKATWYRDHCILGTFMGGGTGVVYCYSSL